MSEATQTVSLDAPAVDALKAVDIAIALGAEIPAPVKSFVHIAKVEIVDEDDGRNNYGYIVGAYQSNEDAEAGLVGWVLERWTDAERAPFYDLWDRNQNEDEDEDLDYDDLEKIYIREHTDKEILKAYFNAFSDSYEIEKVYVKSVPSREELLA